MIEFYRDRRSTQMEIMDDIDFQGEEMGRLLRDLKVVNQWLGGYKISMIALSNLLVDIPKNKTIRILDLGCGDGQMLRMCCDFVKKKGYEYEGIGIDFNENILKIAKEQSLSYPNIHYSKLDVVAQGEALPKCDITLCTLFLHHFPEKKLETLLQLVLDRTEYGIIINDLQRSRLAFRLFQIFGRVALQTQTARFDGLVSIARGFSQQELQRMANSLQNQSSKIHWKWAFRYLWVLKKTNAL